MFEVRISISSAIDSLAWSAFAATPATPATPATSATASNAFYRRVCEIVSRPRVTQLARVGKRLALLCLPSFPVCTAKRKKNLPLNRAFICFATGTRGSASSRFSRFLFSLRRTGRRRGSFWPPTKVAAPGAPFTQRPATAPAHLMDGRASDQ